MHVTAIIAAGGRGQRFGGASQAVAAASAAADPRASVDAFLDHPAESTKSSSRCRLELVGDPPPYLRARRKPLRLVAGGERRQDSVAERVSASPTSGATSIVIHDAARPFASADLISRTIAAAAEIGAALGGAAGAAIR